MNKKLTLIAALYVSSSLHSMQSVLDYIQKYGKPAAKNVLNHLLLHQRMMAQDLRIAYNQGHIINDLFIVASIQALAPTIIPLTFQTKYQKDHSFYNAISTGNIPLVKNFLITGYDITKHIANDLQYPLLHQAVRSLQPAIVKILLDAGINPDIHDMWGHIAESYGQFKPTTDTPQEHEKKIEIQKIFRIYKAKRNLAPQIQDLLHKKAARPIIQETIEQITGSGAQDIAGIIKGYL